MLAHITTKFIRTMVHKARRKISWMMLSLISSEVREKNPLKDDGKAEEEEEEEEEGCGYGSNAVLAANNDSFLFVLVEQRLDEGGYFSLLSDDMDMITVFCLFLLVKEEELIVRMMGLDSRIRRVKSLPLLL